MAAQPTVQARAYRDFLTPLLHRRFTDASIVVLALCWLEATFLSSSSLLWALNPLGTTGLRTLLLFIPCLAIFIVRLSDLHFGQRTTVSDWETFCKEFCSLKALFILAWHVYSAFFFGEVYIWSKGQEADLGWVDHGKAYERPRLNENPMVLRCLYQISAVVATGTHLWWDLGHVEIATSDHLPPTPRSELLAKLPVTLQQLASRLGRIVQTALNHTIAALVITLLTYYIGPRSFALRFAHFFGTLLYQQLPQKAGFVGIIAPLSLLWQAFSSTLMLSTIWAFSNAAFSAFVAQPPLKRGHPLTSEIRDNAGRLTSRSSDPNASLLTGLKSKKDGPHTYAFWELSLICTQFDARRKTIFLEVDRNGGSTWSQILQQCIAELECIATRTAAYYSALQPPQQTNPTTSHQPLVQGLPKIANEPARQGDILTKPKTDLRHSVSEVARSAGSHPRAQNPLSPVARKAFAWSKDQILSPEQQNALSRQGISKETSSKMLDVLRTPVGAPFRESFNRLATSVVLGSPYSSQINIIHAARSLSALLKASLVEDTCGTVAKDVPLVIRTLTSTIVNARHFVHSAQPSWTDVFFDDRQRQIKQIAEVILELQKALEVILLAFSEYASSLGITKKELREAKEAVGLHKQQEMVKV